MIGATSRAMLANLCSRTINAVIETGANIGQTLKATASSDAMKSLIKTGIRAGAIAGVTTGLGIAAPSAPSSVQEAFAPDRIMQHLQHQGFTQAVGCSVDALMGDRHAFHRFGANVAAGTVGTVGAGAIGCAYSKGLIDALSHKVIHAGVGALSGAIVSGKDGAISGAMGAMVSETFADMFKPEGLLEKITAQESALGRRLTATEFAALNSEHTKDITKTAEIAKVIAAASVFAVGGDVQVAHLTACSAIDHNFLPTAFALASLGYTAWCGYEIYSAYEEGGAIAALKQLGIEVVITATGAAAGKMVFKIGSMMYPTAELAVNAILAKNPMLKAVIGSLTDKITSSINALNASALGQAFAKSDAFIVKMGERVVGKGATKEEQKLLWSSWRDHEKISVGGREYAKIGDRLYTQHAVDRMQPSGLGAPAGQIGQGRSIAPIFIENTIKDGVRTVETHSGVERAIIRLGNVEIITEQMDKIVITVKHVS